MPMTCPACGQPLPASPATNSAAPLGTPVGTLRAEVAALARAELPDLRNDSLLGPADVRRFRMAAITAGLRADHADLTAAEADVLDTIAADRLLSENPTEVADAHMSVGDRVADHVATFGGSWAFILSFFGILVGWIVLNAFVLQSRPFDPYPFILLNLVLSCVAAIQAPVIMMSQNRKESRDRQQAEHDYRVNLKAEIEVRLLHEKMDHLMLHQWSRLLDVQEEQSDLLDGIAARLDARGPDAA